VQVDDEFLGDVGYAFGEVCVNDAALGGGVFVISVGQLRQDW